MLDGFDFGAARCTCSSRRPTPSAAASLAAIGPFWDGNEVWLIAAGGVAVRRVSARCSRRLSGVLPGALSRAVVLMLRGIAIEVRSHVVDRALARVLGRRLFAVERSACACCSALRSETWCAAFRSIPADDFTMPFFTDFKARGHVGSSRLLHGQRRSLSVALLAAHGATFLTWRTSGPQRERALALAGRAYLAAAGLFMLVSVETGWVRPELFASMSARPAAWVALVGAIAGGAALVRGRRSGRDQVAFLGSCAVLTGVLVAAAVGLFPTLLHSTLDPAYDVRAGTHSTGEHGLKTALVWWPFAFALVVTYFTVVFRSNRDRVRPEE